MKEEVLTEQAPQPIGPYSQAIKIKDTIFISGQLPINAQTNVMPKSIQEQATCCLENIKNILEKSGFSMDNIVKTTIFMTCLEDFSVVNSIYGEYFKAPFPARSTIQIAALPKGAKIEIEAIAVMLK